MTPPNKRSALAGSQRLLEAKTAFFFISGYAIASRRMPTRSCHLDDRPPTAEESRRRKATISLFGARTTRQKRGGGK